ncbi:hypothetical protein [Aeromonas dhakensis]|uniref:hypothetical protein n=1 Tax=Aeromonas dhakensis TaxID=196024 RepID=UPI000F879DD0|nr:hypothetical protein [Aeromonas dhakensis]RUQ14777.1 hypothetical protein CX648_15065 [Aeromonas dhakensis]
MSAKDAFFKQVEHNADAKKAGEIALQRDIMDFQREIEVLFQAIRTWFEGSPVKSKISLVPLTIEGKRAEFESLTLANGSKTLTVIPEGLYYFGVTGSLVVTIDNPDRAPRKSNFNIYWKDSISNMSGWTIVDDARPDNRVEFNEENFFSKISTFA